MWAIGLGERPAKKSVGQAPLEQRHAVIEHACQEKLPLSIRHLCELLQVNRGWYYAKQHVLVEPSKRAEEVALRDAIERIILDFAGYGYRPGRSVFWYLAIVCGFALGYHLLGQLSLLPPDAFVYSLTSFHGRGFFPDQFHPGDPQALAAAIEALVGLLIEITLIATLTQRFFGK